MFVNDRLYYANLSRNSDYSVKAVYFLLVTAKILQSVNLTYKI